MDLIQDAAHFSKFFVYCSLSLPARHALGIDHKLKSAVAGFAGVSGVGDDRVVGSVADDEELLGGDGAALHQRVVDGQGLGGREMVVAREFLRVGRRVVGVAFDADNLVWEIASQFGGHALDKLVGSVFEIVAARHKDLIASDFGADDVAVLSNRDARDFAQRQIFHEAIVRPDLCPGTLSGGGDQRGRFSLELLVVVTHGE